MTNAEMARVFVEIADLLEIEGSNLFRVLAYRDAAQALGDLGRDIGALIDNPQDLDALPGIGPDLARKVVEIARTGTCSLLQRLRKDQFPVTTELLKIPGMGPKRARSLQQKLGIETLEQLRQAADQGSIRKLHGFSVKCERKLLEASKTLLHQNQRFRCADVEPVAHALLADLTALSGVHQAVAAGSLRRGCETVGNLDLLVTAVNPQAAMARLAAEEEVHHVLEKGLTRCSVELKSGLRVDLRAVAPVSFGAAWIYFTGSKAHNIALRKLAQTQKLHLSEHGLYRGTRRIAGDTESAVYAALGLPTIEPELREDKGELDAARSGTLPRLVQLADLRGDLHTHTRDGYGVDSLASMVAAARAKGLQYLAITDATKGLTTARGLNADALARQIDRIDEMNASLHDFVLLKGVEVAILEDGTLDLPDAVLRRLDLVVGAIRSGFDLSRDKQTDRLVRAMDRPYFSLLAHPSGRLINVRPPCDIDLYRLMRKARERGCFLELNANPARLDLTDVASRMARNEGVLVSINTDAHSHLQFDNLHCGVRQARRGWLQAGDVLNTRPLSALRALLASTMGKGAAAQAEDELLGRTDTCVLK